MSANAIRMRVLGVGSEPPKADPITSLVHGLIAQRLEKSGDGNNPDAWMSYVTVVYCERETACEGEWSYYVYGGNGTASAKLEDWCNANGANYSYLKTQVDDVLGMLSTDGTACVWCIPEFSPNTAIYTAGSVPVFELEKGSGGVPALCLRVGRAYDGRAMGVKPELKKAEFSIIIKPKEAFGGNLWRKWWERPTNIGAPDGVIIDAGQGDFQANGHPWQDDVSRSHVYTDDAPPHGNMLAMSYSESEQKLRVGATFDTDETIDGLAVHEGGSNVSPLALANVDPALEYDLPNAYTAGGATVRPGIYACTEEGSTGWNDVVLSSYSDGNWHRTDDIKAETPSGRSKEPHATATVPFSGGGYWRVYTESGYVIYLYGNDTGAGRYTSFLELVNTFSYDVEVTLSTNASGDIRWDKSNWTKAEELTLLCGYSEVPISFSLKTDSEGYYLPNQTQTITVSRADGLYGRQGGNTECSVRKRELRSYGFRLERTGCSLYSRWLLHGGLSAKTPYITFSTTTANLLARSPAKC